VSSMPYPPRSDDAEPVHEFPGDEVVLGVDTHRDGHVAAVLTLAGAVVGSRGFPTTAAGYTRMVSWASRFGRLRRAGVEGTSSYGAALTRHLTTAGIQVIEVNQPDRAERRRRGKTDTIDAEAAARAVLTGRATALAKTNDGPVEMLRMLKMAKTSAVKSRTQAINQLKAIVMRADSALRDSLTGLSTPRLIRRCAELATTAINTITTTAIYTLSLLARRIQQLAAEIDALAAHMAAIITAHQPDLLQHCGIGPDTAATLLIAAGDNPHRLRSEASFAALCGVSPIEASSGKTQRRRLNRGGDRQANRALYTIAITRLRWDPRTRDYLTRRTTEGKTHRESLRCVKRYIAREIYQLITTPRPASTP
jgi:transposase